MPKPTNPLWAEHTNVIEVVNTPGQLGSGTRRWQCKYCNFMMTSTISRVVKHITGIGTTRNCGGCKQVPKAIKDKLIADKFPAMSSSERVPGSQETQDALQDALVGDFGGSSSQVRGQVGQPSARKKTRVTNDDGDEEVDENMSMPDTHTQQTDLPSKVASLSWVKERQKVAEMEIARTLIECNMSFHILRTDQWKRMVRAIAQVGHTETWTGLDYNRMRTQALDEQKAIIDKALVPVKVGWKQFGCTILSDGWSDVRKRHIINILVSSCLGTYFLGAVDAGKAGERVTADFIYKHIRDAILEIGVENVVQVVTDNASNCKAMGDMVEAEFPSIVWTPCAAHCLDLLMEDVGKLPWIAPTVSDATKITTFICKKHQALAIFRSHS